MPTEPPREKHGKRVSLGDGLGRKGEKEEILEDDGTYHSRMCPINLGRGMNNEIDQPNDRPVEK